MTFLEEKAGEIVLKAAVAKIADYKEKKQWEALFVDANESLLKSVESGDRIIEEIAELFEKLRYIEETHMKRFEAIREKLLQNSMYRSDEESVWICMKCGNVEYGKNPPEKCPVCEHEGTYYKKASEEDMSIIK